MGSHIGYICNRALYFAQTCFLTHWALASHTFCCGAVSPPPPPSLVISQTTGPISKIQTPFDSPVRELSKRDVKFDLDVTDDVTGQVKVRMFDFSGW